MNIEGKKRKSGSAIIIAFLLMAVVSGTVFAIARLFYLDTAAGGLYENSTVAYYAAESGIEEGMLRYRFDRNAHVAEATTDYVNYGKVNRNNLTTGAVAVNASPSATVSQSQQIYDLNMFYKAPYYGTAFDSSGILNYTDLDNPLYGNEYIINRDEAVKIDVTDAVSGTGDLTLWVKLGENDAGSGISDGESFIEARMTGTIGGNLKEFKKVLMWDGGTSGSSLGYARGSYYMMTEITGTNRIYPVEFLKNVIVGGDLFDRPPVDSPDINRVFLYLKPIGYKNIIIGLKPIQTTGTVAAPYSTIKSTGYYGGVGRTLTAKIDRQSGTVYDIFDFVVYQHP